MRQDNFAHRTALFLRTAVMAAMAACCTSGWSAGGTLTVNAVDKTTGDPEITRIEVYRGAPDGKPMNVRRTVPAGMGFVLDRKVDLTLPDGGYFFRCVRGPEYRVVTGNFALERSSLDSKPVELPRMINMLSSGWTSGDCLVRGSVHSVPLRMASEDLHLATVTQPQVAKPIAGRKSSDAIENEPSWIVQDVNASNGLAFYGPDTQALASIDIPSRALVAVARAKNASAEIPNPPENRVAIENPFAWPLPVWLASGQIDGCFVLGDWLRLDKQVMSVKDGRSPVGPTFSDGKTTGLWAETIYWNMLDAGFQMAPLAGSGDQVTGSPIGYNRLYVGKPWPDYQPDSPEFGAADKVQTPESWWAGAWQGNSVATNGPLLRPKLAGRIPGHRFTARSGEELELHVELALTVRDPVAYIEVMHNGNVHYSGRLDEFAKAGGRMPPLKIRESSWVAVRVVTEYKDHYRAALSAPWYITFDDKPRVAKHAVTFFREWLSEYETELKKLPPAELAEHVPFIRSARKFWAEKAEIATDH